MFNTDTNIYALCNTRIALHMKIIISYSLLVSI